MGEACGDLLRIDCRIGQRLQSGIQNGTTENADLQSSFSAFDHLRSVVFAVSTLTTQFFKRFRRLVSYFASSVSAFWPLRYVMNRTIFVYIANSLLGGVWRRETKVKKVWIQHAICKCIFYFFVF